MNRAVTRSVSRVLRRANIQQLRRSSIVIPRNRRFDAVALMQRNVIIGRRVSTQPIQRTRITNRRQSMPIVSAVADQPNHMENRDAQEDVDIAMENASSDFQDAFENDRINDGEAGEAANQMDVQEDNVDIGTENESSDFPNASENDSANNGETAQATNQIDNGEVSADTDGIRMKNESSDFPDASENDGTNDGEAGQAANQVDVQEDDVDIGTENESADFPNASENDGANNGEAAGSANSDDQPVKTCFPGHAEKKGRLSYFNTNQMDQYVQHFQPALATNTIAPRRRRSMMDTNPPLSRSNRFSLDTIPESILATSVPE